MALVITPRSAWNAKPAKRTFKWEGPHRFVAIHCTDTPSDAQARRTGHHKAVRNIQSFHMNAKPRGRGWSDIAYNFLVTQDGEVIEGRGWDRRGGANGFGATNKVDVSISAIINPSEKPSKKMLDALTEFIAAAQARGWTSGVRGHRDFTGKDCPGDKLFNWIMDNVRDGVTDVKVESIIVQPPPEAGKPSEAAIDAAFDAGWAAGDRSYWKKLGRTNPEWKDFWGACHRAGREATKSGKPAATWIDAAFAVGWCQGDANYWKNLDGRSPEWKDFWNAVKAAVG